MRSKQYLVGLVCALIMAVQPSMANSKESRMHVVGIHGQLIVPLVSLLTSPENYVGKAVETIGYVGRDTSEVYLFKDSFESGDTSSGIFIHDRGVHQKFSRSCLESYVTVVGIFDYIENSGGYVFRDISQVLRQRPADICYEDKR